jgi:hypothetical protein
MLGIAIETTIKLECALKLHTNFVMTHPIESTLPAGSCDGHVPTVKGTQLSIASPR